MSELFRPVVGEGGDARAVVLGLIGDKLLLSPEGELPEAALHAGLGTPLFRVQVGWIGEQLYEAAVWAEETRLPEAVQPFELKPLFARWPAELFHVAGRATQLARWLRGNRFCGVCGSPMRTEWAMSARCCEVCGHLVFPRISPACIVAVTRGEEILLARGPRSRPGMYSVLAGFVEAGETAEACAHREVREEVGLEIANLRWFGSQPWPFPDSLMLGFFAEYAGGEIVPQPGEIEEARWFGRDALPDFPFPDSIAARMIRAWRDGTHLQ